MTTSEMRNDSPAFDCMVVTNVQVYPFQEGVSLGHTKGIASIVLNDQFMIRDLRVMDGENGLFVGYPVDPFFKGDSIRSICNPITRQLREHIEVCVLTKYQELVSGTATEEQTNDAKAEE